MIDSVRVIPQSAAFDSLERGYYEDLDEIYTDRISISMSPLKYLTERKIVVNRIIIERPRIFIYYNPKDTIVENEPLALREIFSGNFKGIELKELRIVQASFISQNINNDSPEIRLDSISIYIHQVEINPATFKTKPLGLGFKKVDLEMGYVNLSLNDYYNFSFDEMSFEILANEVDSIKPRTSLKISNIEYAPNTLALEKLKYSKIRVLSSIKSKEIRLTGLQLGDFLFEKELNFEELQIIDPEITQYVNSNMQKDYQKNPSKFAIKNILEKIICKRINLQNGKMLITDIQKNNADLDLEGVNILFNDVIVSDNTTAEPLGMQFSSGILTADHISSDLGQFYTFESGEMEIDFKKGYVQVTKLGLTPKYSKKEFSKVTPFEQDRFDLQIGEVNVRGLDFTKLLNNLSIKLQALEIKDVDLSVFRDKWVPDPEFKYVPLPSRMIRELKFPVTIDTIQIINANIINEQLGDIVEYEDEKPGTMYFTNMFVTGYGLTNDPELLKNNPEFILDARANFMHSEVIEAQFRFVIPDTMDLFYVKGEISSLPTIALDPILKNLLLIQIPGGLIHNMSLDMVGNDSLITGSLDIEYENLYVNILKTKKPTKSSGFMNAMGNTVLKNNNLRTRGKYVTGIVNAERKRNKFLFNFTWQGIKSGLISTMVPFVKAEKARKSKKNKGDGN